MKKLFLPIICLILTIFLLSACVSHELDQSENLPGSVNSTTKQTSEAEASQSEESTDDTGSNQETENSQSSTEPTQITENTTTTPQSTQSTEKPSDDKPNNKLPTYGEYYYDLTNVVLYIEVYGELPPNYITKADAKELGWEGGSVENYKEGAAIGGDHFGNYEGLLPEANGRSYTECDIDTNGYGSRGSRRLVFSNDGLYFYTSDHYESFSEVTVTEDYEVIR